MIRLTPSPDALRARKPDTFDNALDPEALVTLTLPLIEPFSEPFKDPLKEALYKPLVELVNKPFQGTL